MSSWKEYIEDFNSGNTEFLGNFGGDVGMFIDLVVSKGLLKYIKVTPEVGAEEELKLVKAFYEHHLPSYIQFFEENFSDVKYENGNFYFIGEPEDFQSLFDESRNSMSNKTIGSVLTGEVDFDWYDNSTDDVYRDVIDELNKKNLEEFYNAVIHYAKDEQIQPHTELLELIADSQGHPNFVTIDKDNVERIVKDEESMNEILDNELSELKSNLYSLHSVAYNSAYESDVYDEVWNSLDDYFITSQKQWVQVPFYTGYNPQVTKMVDRLRVPIRNFQQIINDYIEMNLESTFPEAITYHSTYIDILKEYLNVTGDWPKVYPPDYPNSSKVDKNLNELFGDYIY